MKQINKNIYITGEKFQQLADITVLTEPSKQFHRTLQNLNLNLCLMNGSMHNFTVTHELRLQPLKSAETIFVYTHLVEAFYREIVPHLEKPVILISHNSDNRIDERFLELIESDKILHWFGQNVAIDHGKVTAIPIGLANSQWSHGQIETFAAVAAQKVTKNRLLYMNFDFRTNPRERLPIYNMFKDNPLITVSNGLAYEAYLKELTSHVFCISPPGNGLDCHRIWECLYLGVIPISLKNPNLEHFYDLPISLIDDWSQIDEPFLQAEFQRILQSSFNMQKIDINYWANRIKKLNSKTVPSKKLENPTKQSKR